MTSWTVAARLLCPWGFSRPEYWNGLPCPSSGDLPNLGVEARSPALQADSLPSQLPGPKNTRVLSLPLLQGNFLIQESNEGLLHWRQILYHLSYPGSPRSTVLLFFKKSRCGNNSAGMVVESREELLFSALAEHTGVGNLWKVHPCVGITDSWLGHPRDNHVPYQGKPPLRTCPSAVLGILKMYSIRPAMKLSPGFCTSVFFNGIPSISGEAREVLE